MRGKNETGSLEEIESQYRTIRLKFGVERRTDKFDTVPEEVPRISLDMVESWTGDVAESREDEPQASTGLVEFREGDVCFSKLRPYLAKGFEAEYFGAASPEFLVFHPTQFETRFLRYLLLSREFIDRVDASTYGAKMPRASWNFIGNVRVPCPDKREQEKITEFLDHRTVRIDALVEKQKRLLNLLDEKRQTVITQAVTKGLDSTVATKSTDVKWLGEIPEGWEAIRLKFLVTGIEQGWSPQCKDRPASSDEWGVLKAGAAKKGRFHEDENKILPSDKEPKSEYEIRQGDLLMNRASGSPELLGSVALVPAVRSQLLLCDKLFRLHVREEIADSEFLSLALRSNPLRHQITAAISGADGLANNIPQSEVKELTIAVPSLSEQKRITQEVLNWEVKAESLTQKIQNSIDLLKEKRQALITAAVTGQIDVTEEHGEIQDSPV